VLLSDDPEADVRASVAATLRMLPEAPLRAFLARTDIPDEILAFFAGRGITPMQPPSEADTEPLLDAMEDMPDVPDEKDEQGKSRLLSSLSITDRMKLAMKGTREQRATLVRDTNRIVATAVLSSPKLTEAEVEAFAKMANVSEDVLRIIGTNRTWLKNYSVALALTKNPKTPPGISMQLLHRLAERDMKMLSMDRNVPEALRLAARRLLVKQVK
jgi:hypothetical protein